jgi:hypothetical protein
MWGLESNRDRIAPEPATPRAQFGDDVLGPGGPFALWTSAANIQFGPAGGMLVCATGRMSVSASPDHTRVQRGPEVTARVGAFVQVAASVGRVWLAVEHPVLDQPSEAI